MLTCCLFFTETATTEIYTLSLHDALPIAILKLCANEYDGLEIRALHDGDRIEPYEPVMHIEGDYTAFAHLETPVLGTLARRTLITTNVVHVLEAANGKPIIFMAARHDHHRIQTGDGYAAYVAGQVVGT